MRVTRCNIRRHEPSTRQADVCRTYPANGEESSGTQNAAYLDHHKANYENSENLLMLLID